MRRPLRTLLSSVTWYRWGLAAFLVLNGCSKSTEPEVQEASATTVDGRVVEADDANRGVPGASVRAVGKAPVATTDSTGLFSLPVDAASGEILQISITKAGYDEVVRSMQVQQGGNTMPTVSLPVAGGSSGGGTNPSGSASAIFLKSASATSIGVRHSGSNETALLVFEVRDALGRPVDFGHRAVVRFVLTQRAGGGAVISPDTVSTDALGLVAAALNAGTLAQAVQVRAEVVGTTIYSDPVRVAIHGGPPDARHFSFAVERFNVPGLVRFGDAVPVTAFVGDRYSNPVPTGTVVYFATAGGIIQGSALTDDLGRATAELITAEPTPNAVPALSDSAGIARISVQTVDENRAPITRSALAVMFSGHTELAMSPQTFDIPVGGSQTFTVTVWDREHHNPLTAGTSITFTASLGTVAGESTIGLPDTMDRAYTTFTFRLENHATGAVLVGPDRVGVPLTSRTRPVSSARAGASSIEGGSSPHGVTSDASVSVKVTSPNGDARVTVTGDVAEPPAP